MVSPSHLPTSPAATTGDGQHSGRPPSLRSRKGRTHSGSRVQLPPPTRKRRNVASISMLLSFPTSQVSTSVRTGNCRQRRIRKHGWCWKPKTRPAKPAWRAISVPLSSRLSEALATTPDSTCADRTTALTGMTNYRPKCSCLRHGGGSTPSHA